MLPLGIDQQRRLCRVDEIPNHDSRGFLTIDFVDQVFAVRRDQEVFVYLNTCPHEWIELDFAKDRFLGGDRREIMCFAHGAHFDIATGRCTLGVCEGKYLIPVPHRIEDGWVMIGEKLPPHPRRPAEIAASD